MLRIDLTSSTQYLDCTDVTGEMKVQHERKRHHLYLILFLATLRIRLA